MKRMIGQNDIEKKKEMTVGKRNRRRKNITKEMRQREGEGDRVINI